METRDGVSGSLRLPAVQLALPDQGQAHKALRREALLLRGLQSSTSLAHSSQSNLSTHFVPKVFPTTESLKEHYAQSVRHAYCQPCDEAFRSQDTLRTHLKGEHQDRYCDTCDQARFLPSSVRTLQADWLGDQLFGSAYALKEHHVQSPRHAYCQYCDRHFRTHELLRQHNQVDHYLCEICKKAGVRSSVLPAAAKRITRCSTHLSR